MGNRNLVLLGVAVLLANAIRFAPAVGAGGQAPGGGQVRNIRQTPASSQPKPQEAQLIELPDDNPFVLLCSRFAQAETVQQSPGPALIPPACQADLWTPGKSGATTAVSKLRFTIATVPDPEETHLTLVFDRIVESVRRAAEDGGYSLDIHWLPWLTPAFVAKEQEETDPDKVRGVRQKREMRRRWPGLLLFRQAKSGSEPSYLAVFLIGESPISGIDRVQFANALAYIPAEAAPPILGPCFSGSATSLQESLAANGHTVGRILSGSATSLHGQGSSTQHNDTFARRKLLAYLKGLVRDDALNLALIYEGATGYGREASGGDDNVIGIAFPKDIARLRNAYEEQTKSQAGAAQPQAIPSLTLKLRDELGGRDSVASYSTAQTPLAQDRVLNEIAAILNLDKIRTAGVIATDVLDTIFLMRYLHQSCPDVHLFTMDSDLLVARSGDSVSLLGTLAATTYPLFGASQDYTSNDRHLVFDSALSEGTYNAMRLLLRDKADDSLTDYSTPLRFHSPSTPPLWLTVVARNGYQPIALLEEGVKDPMLLPAQILPQKTRAKPDQTTPRIFVLIFACIAILCAVWVAALVFGQCAEWRPLSDFNLRMKEPGAAGRAAILSVGTSALAALMWVVFSAPLKFVTKAEIGSGQWIGMFVIGALLLPALILIELWLVRKAFAPMADQLLRTRCVAIGALAGFVAFGLAWNHLLWGDTHLRSFFFMMRGVDLVSGVSPMLPFLLLLPAFMIWSWVSLQRRIFIDERRPVLPDASLKPVAPLSRLAKVSIDEAIVGGQRRSSVKGALLCLAAGGLVLWQSKSYLHSVEQTTFDWVFRIALSVLAGIIFLAWGQFLLLWRRFQLWLEQVELHPLRYALSRLPQDKCWSPLWVRQIRKRNYVVTARSLETLDCLLEHCRGKENLPAGLKDLAADVFETAAHGDREALAGSRELQEKLGKVAGMIQTGILQEQWQKGGSDALVALACSDEWKDALKRTSGEAEEQTSYILASEFVALRYVAYIRYVTLHLENLLAFMSGGFILIVLSLSSYPFLSQHLIGWLIGIMFVILTAGIVRVFAQMDRDATLSRLTKTDAGKLGGAFYLKLASFGALPVLTLLSAYFPTIGSFLGSLVQPAVQALH